MNQQNYRKCYYNSFIEEKVYARFVCAYGSNYGNQNLKTNIK